MRWLFLLIPLLCWRAMATGLIGPEDGMVDMSRWLWRRPVRSVSAWQGTTG